MLDDLLLVEKAVATPRLLLFDPFFDYRSIGIGRKTRDDHTLIVMKCECLAILHRSHEA